MVILKLCWITFAGLAKKSSAGFSLLNFENEKGSNDSVLQEGKFGPTSEFTLVVEYLNAKYFEIPITLKEEEKLAFLSFQFIEPQCFLILSKYNSYKYKFTSDNIQPTKQLNNVDDFHPIFG